ncbi:hypothetical protein QZJ86_09880 [Methylomonas montana]|uniref:hypothetical protein n=1 Tax=Methylomonas montana TaxID=3058963 RepID=UPI00265AF49D|nr:hypothetical protein [Methylomonas montana]WKJ92431.1 hypothetical protein QZJ86_09880 [Methylomonas montana]
MKFLENILKKSRIIDELFQNDLQERSDDRQACAEKIHSLSKALRELPTDQLTQAEKEVADSTLKLAQAQRKYSELATEIEGRRRKLLSAIQAEEQKLQQLKPLIIQQAVNNLHERVQSAGPLTPNKTGLLNGIFEELRTLPLVVDDKRLLSCIADIDGRIQAIFN